MSHDQDADDARSKGAEALDKAKAGAKRLGGWLSRAASAAAERAKDNPAVRDALDQVGQKMADRAEAARERDLQTAYAPAVERIAQLLERFEARLGELETAKGVLHQNITALQLRGAPAADPELRDYQAELTRLTDRQEQVRALLTPVREERDRLERRYTTAVTRLTTGAETLESLKAAAAAQAAEALARLDALLGGDDPGDQPS